MSEELTTMSALSSTEVSEETKAKARHFKARLENRMRRRFEEQTNTRVAQIKLERMLRESTLTEEEKDQARQQYGAVLSSRLRRERTAMGVHDFDVQAVIGKGAFGEVRVVTKRGKTQLFAMKSMRKDQTLAKNQRVHAQLERNLLVQADHPFLVKLFYAFQDSVYLYLVMEFCGGGDLMTVLIREDVLTEEATRFYMAELALAIQAVHDLDFVHRDLKPDNILIANNGHIKLADFGLAKSFNTENDTLLVKYEIKRNTLTDTTPAEDARAAAGYRADKSVAGGRYKREKLFSTVGTPDYIAPEVFSQKGYNHLVDWWSLGVIMFECLIGYPPFYAEDPLQTCRKIVRYRRYFRIPVDSGLSDAATEAIMHLVCSNRRRWDLGALQSCDFFVGVDWDRLQERVPPFIPSGRGALTESFPEAHALEVGVLADDVQPSSALSQSHFWNFEFSRTFDLSTIQDPENYFAEHGVAGRNLSDVVG